MGLFGLCAISENKSFGSAERFVRYCAPYTRTARVQKAGGRSSNQNQERFDVFPRLVEVDAYLPHMGYSSRVHHLEHYVLFVSRRDLPFSGVRAPRCGLLLRKATYETSITRMVIY